MITINYNFHFYPNGNFAETIERLDKIMNMQETIAARLEAGVTQLNKAKAEIIAAINEQGTMSPRLQTALDAFGTVTQELDDVHTDAAALPVDPTMPGVPVDPTMPVMPVDPLNPDGDRNTPRMRR